MHRMLAQTHQTLATLWAGACWANLPFKGPQVGPLAVLFVDPDAVRQVSSTELCQVAGLQIGVHSR